MKKLFVCFSLAAFALTPVFAGEKCCKDKAAADQAKAACPVKSAKAACPSQSACSKSVSKKSVLSPKAAEAKKTAVAN
jgi:hypothetical protein